MASIIENFETGGNTDEALGDLGGNEYDTAMSFSLDGKATIEKVELYVKKVNTISSAITMRIETNAAGPKPSGTLADVNATTTATPTQTSYDWSAFTFATPFELVGSTKFWIVCTVPNQANDNRYEWYLDTDGGYVRGGKSTSFNGGAWGNEISAQDLYFRVYGTYPETGAPMFFSGGVTIG